MNLEATGKSSITYHLFNTLHSASDVINKDRFDVWKKLQAAKKAASEPGEFKAGCAFYLGGFGKSREEGCGATAGTGTTKEACWKAAKAAFTGLSPCSS